MLKEFTDFVISAGDCPSDGCPEYFFDHKTSFPTDYVQVAYRKAMDTIEKHKSSWLEHKAKESMTDQESTELLEKVKKDYPDASLVTTIFSCKHGKILYHTSIRFQKMNTEKTNGLVKRLNQLLPDFKTKGRRAIESYIITTKDN